MSGGNPTDRVGVAPRRRDGAIVLPRFGLIATLFLAAGALPGVGSNAAAQPAETVPLQLEAKIALGNVHGRIDHMAVDLKRQRLFVAE